MERKIWARAQDIKIFLSLQGTFKSVQGPGSQSLSCTARHGHGSEQSRALPWQAATRRVSRLAAWAASGSRAGDTSWLSQEAGMSWINF